MCEKVAARVADDPAWADVVHLDLLSERFDALRYFTGDTTPIKARRRARCPVPRT
jgi:hypothetical protein